MVGEPRGRRHRRLRSSGVRFLLTRLTTPLTSRLTRPLTGLLTRIAITAVPRHTFGEWRLTARHGFSGVSWATAGGTAWRIKGEQFCLGEPRPHRSHSWGKVVSTVSSLRRVRAGRTLNLFKKTTRRYAPPGVIFSGTANSCERAPSGIQGICLPSRTLSPE